MAEAEDDLATVAALVEGVRALGFSPILVGGMALVVLGSKRVTVDFDFLVPHPAERLKEVVRVFYEHGFELISRLNEAGDVKATIDNAAVAAIRLRIDKPASALFFHPVRTLRVDLLFDFPLPAADLAKNATQMKIGSHTFHIASDADLLRLKLIAQKDRDFAGDAQDIEFLKRRLRSRAQ